MGTTLRGPWFKALQTWQSPQWAPTIRLPSRELVEIKISVQEVYWKVSWPSPGGGKTMSRSGPREKLASSNDAGPAKPHQRSGAEVVLSWMEQGNQALRAPCHGQVRLPSKGGMTGAKALSSIQKIPQEHHELKAGGASSWKLGSSVLAGRWPGQHSVSPVRRPGQQPSQGHPRQSPSLESKSSSVNRSGGRT